MIRSYKLAKKNLRSHRTRTLLTVLGVMIGVFIISLVMIISGSLKQSIVNQVSALNGRIVVIRSGSAIQTGMSAFSPLNMSPVSTLGKKDIETVAKTADIENSAPMIFASGGISGQENDYKNSNIVATTSSFAKIFNLKFNSGGWFDEADQTNHEVILGNKLALGLFGSEQAVGQIIDIKGVAFTVVGVVKELDQPISLAGTDMDKTAFISLKQAELLDVSSDQVSQIITKMDSDNFAKTQKNISQNLAKNHRDQNEFQIMNGAQTSEILSEWLSTLTAAALIFASVSLLVGGIGIMNIMFVSVTERIREIGLRKAVGATRRDIFTQFLAESLLMTFYGAVSGLLFAYFVGWIISINFSLPMIFDPSVFLVGIVVPAGIAVIFGTWPAVRAARQDPITALKNPN